MAKNWFDGPIPTPEIGILGGLPSLQLTEEDKRRAWAQMLMQGGLATAAASLGGANTGRALGTGLLGGAEAYGQGLQAPAARMDAYAKQLKMQGDQIGNAKGMEELAKLKRDASDYASKNDFLSMLNDPGRAAMLYGGGPSVQNEQRASQFGANPAMMLSDPRMNLKALQAGVDPKQLGAALENTRPFKMDAGAMYQYGNGQREQIPQAQPGMTMRQLPDGSYTAVPIAGYNAIIGDQELNKGMGQNNARLWLEAQQRKNTVVNQPMESGKVQPVTAQAQLDYANRNNSSVFNVPPDVQAQRDAVAQSIYNAEGAGKFSPRIDGRKGVSGVRPQVANLDQPGTPSPIVQGAKQALNTNWIEKTYQPLIDAGSAAQANLDNIRGLRNIELKTGAGTETLVALANWGAAFGVPKAEQYASNVQKFRSLAMENVNKELNLAKGPQTDQDAARAQSIFAQLGNTPQANQFLLDYREAVERYKQRAAAFHQDGIAIASNTGDLSEVSRRWRKVAGSIWDDPVMQKWERRK